jgi:hypothetical protein
MTVASSSWVRGDASSSYGSRYRSYSADLKGIHWAPAEGGHLDNYDPANSEGTIYQPLSSLGICLPTTFDISKEEFQAAAAFDGAQLDSVGIMSTMSGPSYDLTDYAVVASIEAEGYASGVDKEGYADSFWTDEAEIYLGLYNDANGDGYYDDDELVGAVQVEVDLRRKVDILFAGGTGLAEAAEFLDALSDANIKDFIKKIEISYASFGDPVDPLVADIGAFATEIGSAIVADAPNLASLIEIEAGNPHASSWAKNVFPALLCDCEVAA